MDPSGMGPEDWYKGADGSKLWLPGSASTVEHEGQSYTRIGTGYTAEYATHSVVYEQNNAVAVIDKGARLGVDDAAYVGNSVMGGQTLDGIQTPNGNNLTIPTLEGWQHFIGPSLLGLALPTPKRFIAKGASENSAVLSEIGSKLYPKKIEIGPKTAAKLKATFPKVNWQIQQTGHIRRLYTHTVKDVPRYAATWGRYLGRIGTRVAGVVGLAVTSYDIATEIAIPMGQGVQKYTETHRDDGIIYHVK